MISRFQVVKGFGNYRIGEIISIDQNINYTLWQYIAIDKFKEGAVKYYMPSIIYDNKMSTPQETK